MDSIRRIAIAMDMDMPYSHHQSVFVGAMRYAEQHDSWECVIDEFPGLQSRHRSERFQRYDGIIARVTPEISRRAKRIGIPLVNVWYGSPVRSVPTVFTDPVKVGAMAAEHLLDRGFRRLYAIFSIDQQYRSDVYDAFKTTAESASAVCEAVYLPRGDYTEARYYIDLEKRLEKQLDQVVPPAAYFICGVSVSRLLVALCQGRGWNVPSDIAVINEYESIALIDQPKPALTHLDMNHERVGYEAAAMLDRMIEGNEVPTRRLLIPPKGVVAKESTDYYAVQDDVVAEALRLISGNLHKRLSVEMIADGIGVSSRSLQLRFADALGRGVAQEVRRLRVSSAKRMLHDPARQLDEVAKLCGLGSSDTLCKIFRRDVGQSPTAYRKEVLGSM